MTLYANGKKALGICDVCGFTYKLRQLKDVVRNRVRTGLKACPSCWEDDHPQYELSRIRIEDAQAIRDPRPDYAERASLRGITIDVSTVVGIAFLDPVTVTTT